LDTALIVVGYLVVAVGSGMMLWLYRYYINTTRQAQLYELSATIGCVLLVWAWWSILRSLNNVSTHLGRRSLWIFALGTGSLAVGYVGEVRDFAPVYKSGPIIASLLVTIAGLCVAALGFWRMSRSTVRERSEAEPPSVDEHPLRGSRTSILIGYGALGLGTAIGEWLNHGYSDHFMRGLLDYDTAVVVSFAVTGIAWWLCLGELPILARSDRTVRRSLRIFGMASAMLALGNLLLLGTIHNDQVLNDISFVLCAAGLVAVTAGFWTAAKGPRTTLESPQVVPPVPLVPQP